MFDIQLHFKWTTLSISNNPDTLPLFFPITGHEGIGGSAGTAPRLLNLGTRRRCGQFHALVASPLEKGPWYPLDKALGGLQNRSGRCGENKNLLSLTIYQQSNPQPSRYSD
jgi:hypothetical protein